MQQVPKKRYSLFEEPEENFPYPFINASRLPNLPGTTLTLEFNLETAFPGAYMKNPQKRPYVRELVRYLMLREGDTYLKTGLQINQPLAITVRTP